MKAGILVNRIDGSQLGFNITKCINHISENMVNVDIIVFTREPSTPPITPLFSVMSEVEVWGFNAPIISTSLETASTLIDMVGPTKKYFYIWDLEWMRLEGFMHKDLSKVYNHEDIELISRSERHRRITGECWRYPSHIMDDFNHKDLIRIINNE
tara:strand:+ start:12751 stop:13215 length:465 start_codon:yes stop_codon:yes gene_type:complete